MTVRRFEQRTVIITGGGSGMGRAAALRLGSEGANVVVAGRRTAQLQAVVDDIVGEGGSAIAVPTDVADEEQVRMLVAQAVAAFGGLHLAWNNAGVLGGFGDVRSLDLAAFDAMMAINLRGVFACVKHQLAAMAPHAGCAIVNTSSWTAHGAMAGFSAYAAGKAALDAMTRSVALEVGKDGIRINSVSPGVIATPMSAGVLESEAAAQPFVRQTPLGRIGRPEDVGDAVLWLLSADARFVTGQSVLIDGGFTIGGPRL